MARFAIAFAFFIALLSACAPDAPHNDPNATALAFVRQSGLNQNLSDLSFQYGRLTQTYRIISATVGEMKAQMLFKEEISKAAPKYQDEWDRNLAASYVETFSPQEIESLLADAHRSPYKKKFLESQDIVGERMKAKSSHLLEAVMAEAMQNAFTKIVPKK